MLHGEKGATKHKGDNSLSELPKTKSTENSIVFITMHKAASVFVNEVLDLVLMHEGMVHVDFAGEAFQNGVKEWEYCVSKSHLFSTQGYYFGAFRGPYIDKFGDLSANRIVVQVRDPRDCIVSLYYSYKYSHGAPGEGVLKKIFNRIRSHVEDTEIDDFALEQAKTYSRRLAMITDLCNRYEDHILLKYEHMVSDFEKWEGQLYGFLGIDPSPAVRVKVKALATFDVESEDVTKHKRQVTPGDHERKLKPRTVAQMNEILSEHLIRYDYL